MKEIEKWEKIQEDHAANAFIFDYKKIKHIEVDGIDHSDAPDFSDAYISYAEYDGRKMTDEEIDQLNEDSDFVYESVCNWLW